MRYYKYFCCSTYLGTSNDSAYGLTKALECSRFMGLKRFQSIQNNFSLLNRRFLDELANVCRQESVSLLPYSPIAGGVLSGKYQEGARPENARFVKYWSLDDPRLKTMAERFVNSKTLASTAKYIQIANDAGMSPTTLAVAWNMNFDFVASTIIGATNPQQLDDSLQALQMKISPDVLSACDAVHREILYPMG